MVISPTAVLEMETKGTITDIHDLFTMAESTQTLGYAGYELLTTLALRQLRLNQSVILDSVASFERIREQWRDLSKVYGAEWRVIECVCSDETIHQTRLTTRQRGIPG